MVCVAEWRSRHVTTNGTATFTAVGATLEAGVDAGCVVVVDLRDVDITAANGSVATGPYAASVVPVDLDAVVPVITARY